MKMLQKKNNSGFTLIELLAVIIILGVLLLIAVPAVSRYIEQSRLKTYRTNLGQLIDAVKLEVNAYTNDFSFKVNEYLVVPVTCIETETGLNDRSPFGRYVENNTFVLVNKNTKGEFDYYISARDEIGYGVPFSLANSYDNLLVKQVLDDELGRITNIGVDFDKIENNIIFDGKIPKFVSCDRFTGINQSALSSVILKNNTVQLDSSIDFGKPSSKTNGRGLYYTNKNTKDNKTTYYFRGAVENNYVSFANKIWRIVRINEDGSIRIITQDSIGMNVFNEFYEDNAYLGYMYGKVLSKYLGDINGDGIYSNQDYLMLMEDINAGVKYTGDQFERADLNFDGEVNITDAQMLLNYLNGDSDSLSYLNNKKAKQLAYNKTHANENSSTIKGVLDTWYENNLKSKYSSYIADAGFCNDRSVNSSANEWISGDTALGYGTNRTYYGAYNRIHILKQPQFACPNVSNDLFTVSNGKGNKKLINPIGLITVDEAVYAGAYAFVRNEENRYEGTSDFYMNIGNEFWTMSPGAYTAEHARMFDIGKGGAAWYNYLDINDTRHVRPVINLKADIEIIGGNGTISSPYIIKTS